ncbi:MAG: sigma-70 family RNA polymerase sigma factor [Oscillospiraceae bacterium]|nr:sigma-70 family RNA polymerase sigma factor [Oscillospiraceae bacterium]
MNLDNEQTAQIEALYKEMFKKMYAYGRTVFSDCRLAEEAIQETFIIVCSKAGQVLSSENPQGWIMNALKNVSRNIKRSRAYLNAAAIPTAPQEKIENCGAHVDDHFEFMYSDMLSKEDYELLKRMVIYNYTIKELAQELGISEEACKKRVQRTKKKLAELIKKDL